MTVSSVPSFSSAQGQPPSSPGTECAGRYRRAAADAILVQAGCRLRSRPPVHVRVCVRVWLGQWWCQASAGTVRSARFWIVRDSIRTTPVDSVPADSSRAPVDPAPQSWVGAGAGVPPGLSAGRGLPIGAGGCGALDVGQPSPLWLKGMTCARPTVDFKSYRHERSCSVRVLGTLVVARISGTRSIHEPPWSICAPQSIHCRRRRSSGASVDFEIRDGGLSECVSCLAVAIHVYIYTYI